MTCEVKTSADGSVVMISCSRGQPQRRNCKFCNRATERVFLCDEPLRGGKTGQTCSKPMCERCATLIGADEHLCPPHVRARKERGATPAPSEADSRLDEMVASVGKHGNQVAQPTLQQLTAMHAADASHVDEPTVLGSPASAWTKLEEPAPWEAFEEQAAQQARDEQRDLDDVDRDALDKMFPDWDRVPSDSGPPTLASGQVVDGKPGRYPEWATRVLGGEKPHDIVENMTPEQVDATVDDLERVHANAQQRRDDEKLASMAGYIRDAFKEPPPNYNAAIAAKLRKQMEADRAKLASQGNSRQRERVQRVNEAAATSRATRDSPRGSDATGPRPVLAAQGADAPIAEKVAWVRSQTGQDRDRTCHWPGCTEQVPPAKWGCRKHWYELPLALRNEIWAAYKPGQEINMTPSRDYLAVMRKVDAYIRRTFAPVESVAEPEGGPKFERVVRETRARDEARAVLRAARPEPGHPNAPGNRFGDGARGELDSAHRQARYGGGAHPADFEGNNDRDDADAAAHDERVLFGDDDVTW